MRSEYAHVINSFPGMIGTYFTIVYIASAFNLPGENRHGASSSTAEGMRLNLPLRFFMMFARDSELKLRLLILEV